MTEQLRDEVAQSLHAIQRNRILARIERGECSASMSGIEYYPKWEDAQQALKAPYLEQADVAIAIVLHRVLRIAERAIGPDDYAWLVQDEIVEGIKALQEQNGGADE